MKSIVKVRLNLALNLKGVAAQNTKGKKKLQPISDLTVGTLHHKSRICYLIVKHNFRISLKVKNLNIPQNHNFSTQTTKIIDSAKIRIV